MGLKHPNRPLNCNYSSSESRRSQYNTHRVSVSKTPLRRAHWPIGHNIAEMRRQRYSIPRNTPSRQWLPNWRDQWETAEGRCGLPSLCEKGELGATVSSWNWSHVKINWLLLSTLDPRYTDTSFFLLHCTDFPAIYRFDSLLLFAPPYVKRGRKN